MRPIFEKIPRAANGLPRFNTGALTDEAGNRLLTEDSKVINQERGTIRSEGWAIDPQELRFITFDAPSNPLLSEGLAYAADGTVHVTVADPANPTIDEGIVLSSTGALHLFDTSATLLTEAGNTLTTEAGDQLVAEAATAFTFAGIPVTAAGQITYA